MNIGHGRLVDVAEIPGHDACAPGIRLNGSTDSHIRHVVTVIVSTTCVADQNCRLVVAGNRRVRECKVLYLKVTSGSEIVVLPIAYECDITFGRPVDIEAVYRMSLAIQASGKGNRVKASTVIPR